MKILFWFSRGLAILFVLFISLFALDVFGQGNGFWGTTQALFMHLLPSIVMAILVWVTWRKPLFAAAAFLLLAFSYLFAVNGELRFKLPIFVPAFLVGALYLSEFFISRKKA
jgi:hypothetical protein